MLNIAARLREPSTWGGLALLAGMVLPSLSPELLGGVAQLGQAAAGLALIALKEAPKR